jgi:hypothetical protein
LADFPKQDHDPLSKLSFDKTTGTVMTSVEAERIIVPSAFAGIVRSAETLVMILKNTSKCEDC